MLPRRSFDSVWNRWLGVVVKSCGSGSSEAHKYGRRSEAGDWVTPVGRIAIEDIGEKLWYGRRERCGATGVVDVDVRRPKPILLR